MTPHERKQLIQSVVDRHVALNRVFDDMCRVVGSDPEAPLWNEVWKTAMLLLDVSAQQVGDEDGTLDWYVHENDCGAKGLEAGVNGDMRPIRTVDDLVWFMEV